jgi:hypothetical protein
MAKQCRLCGGLAEFVGKNVFGVDVYECSICKEPGHAFRFKETTLFAEITKSPEVLAEKLVYCEEPERFCENASWCSLLLGKVSYAKKAEAIAATVAKLNEVVEH